MISLRLTTNGEKEYEAACQLARSIYNQEIKVSPTHFPPQFIVLCDNDKVVACLGIYPAEEASTFLTESYCHAQGIDPPKQLGLAKIFRHQTCEIGCLAMEKGYRRNYLSILIGATYETIFAMGIKFAYLIKMVKLDRALDFINLKPIELCSPRINDFNASEDLREKWNRIYFSQLKPVCCIVDIFRDLGAYYKKKALNLRFFPPFVIEGELRLILESAAADQAKLAA